MSAGPRDPVRPPGLTNPYRISRMGGVIHWLIWFGLVRHYQSLPTRTCPQDGAFGLEAAPFTIAYQVRDLGAPCRVWPLPTITTATGD